jgi:hypothetical protein
MRPSLPSLLRGRPFRLYLAGLGLILAGAWSIEATASLVPMSLASSAALLLSLPFFRQLLGRMRPSDPSSRSDGR